MKRITLLFVMFSMITWISCNRENDLDSSSEFDTYKRPVDKVFKSVNVNRNLDFCSTPKECVLIAGQHIDAGTVTVSNDANNLYVKVFSKAGFQSVEENIKMWIGNEPPSRRPPAGHFPYKVTETGDTHIFEIPLNTLPDWTPECMPQDLVIIVHADVMTESDGGQTAFGGCDGAIGRPWWAYMEYQTKCCEEGETNLGWLYKTSNSNLYVTCFEFNDEEDGFSNELHYTWMADVKPNYPIWINVEENCEINNVIQVGRVFFSVVTIDSEPHIKLQVKMKDSFEFEKLSYYVGWTNPVDDNGVLNLNLEDVFVKGNNDVYTKNVSEMQGTRPNGANPGFYVIVKAEIEE